MQLTTVIHLIALIVPIVVLAVLNVLNVEPSGALVGALAALSSYAGASTVIGYTKDRIVLGKTMPEIEAAERDVPISQRSQSPAADRKRWAQESPVPGAKRGGGDHG